MFPSCLALGPLPSHLISSNNHNFFFFIKFIDFSTFRTHMHLLWSPPPTNATHHLLGLLSTYLQPTTCHLIHSGCATCATHTTHPSIDPCLTFHRPVHYATHSVQGSVPLLGCPATVVNNPVLHGSLATSLDRLWTCTPPTLPLSLSSQGQPVLVFSPITDLIFKSTPLQLCCRWSLLKIKSVIGFVDM